MPAIERIARFSARHDLPWSEPRRDQFETYLDLIEKFDGSMDLVGVETRDAIVDELLLDSLAPAVLEPPRGDVLDVGTGAGFPGIPLAILFSEPRFTLVDPRRDRCTFLKIAANRLGLETVEPVRSRIEEHGGGPYDWLVSKAFRPPDQWLETAVHHASDEGRIVCMAGAQTRAEVQAAARRLGLRVVAECDDTAELSLPSRHPPRMLYVLA